MYRAGRTRRPVDAVTLAWLGGARMERNVGFGMSDIEQEVSPYRTGQESWMPEAENPGPDWRVKIEIVSRRLRDGIVLRISGEIDLAAAQTVDEELLRAETSHDLVALDLSNTSFVDSTGLQMIITADRRLRARGGRLLIVEGQPQVRRLFELTGVAKHLEVVRDTAELNRAAATCG
jgi:anti-anti-sigma factor